MARCRRQRTQCPYNVIIYAMYNQGTMKETARDWSSRTILATKSELDSAFNKKNVTITGKIRGACAHLAHVDKHQWGFDLLFTSLLFRELHDMNRKHFHKLRPPVMTKDTCPCYDNRHSPASLRHKCYSSVVVLVPVQSWLILLGPDIWSLQLWAVTCLSDVPIPWVTSFLSH